MKTKTKAPAEPVVRAEVSAFAPPAPSAGQVKCPQPEPSPQVKAETTQPRQPPTLAEMLRMGDWLNAQEAAQVGNESLAQALARLNSLAEQGSEEALKTLVQSGNYVARSLFILWARGDQSQREFLRRVAANDSSFPVTYHQEKVHNLGWGKMVLDLAIGSAGPRRPDANQRSASDVVDAMIDAFICTVESLKKMPAKPSLPDEFQNIPELVAENAKELASRIVQSWEKSDPEFRNLAPASSRSLGKRKGKKERVQKKRPLTDSSLCVPEDFSAQDKKKLADTKQTTADIRTDLTEKITSRLKSRLKASPKKTS